MFKEKLYSILKEFNHLTKHYNKTRVLKNRVAKKLKHSVEQYNENLESTIKYLVAKNSVTVLKGIVKKFGKETEEDND